MNFIDYSQYASWLKCKWFWWETNVLRRAARRVGQRDDALALGSLVHSGLERWHKHREPTIDPEVVASIDPKPECLQFALQLVLGYAQRYPQEPWQVKEVEKAVPFDLELDHTKGVAKLDGYFQLTATTEVDDGLGGVLTLPAGYYSLEHKTKDMGMDKGLWMRQWEVRTQGSFQMLALQAKLGAEADVQGVLVNVLEKPRQYTPKRKCNACGESMELWAWIATPKEREFACVLCGKVQELSEYKPKGPPRPPEYWRMWVRRSPEMLRKHYLLIQDAAVEMQQARLRGVAGFTMGALHPNLDNCVDPFRRKECEFFRPHTYNFTTIGHPDYTETEDYLGLAALQE